MFLLLAQTLPATLPATQPADNGPWWSDILKVVISGVLTILLPFVVNFLKSHAQAAQAAAAADAANLHNTALDTRTILLDQLKSFIWGAAADIAETRFPELAKDIVSGKVGGSNGVKQELAKWGTELKNDVITHFGNQGIDIVAAFGEKYIDSLISQAANAVSPVPGAETSAVLAEASKNTVNDIINKGVQAVKAQFMHFNNITPTTIAPVPPSVTSPSP